MPHDRQALRDEFVQRFPREDLRDMSLEKYAMGQGDQENFCYWLEVKTLELGSIRGGSAAKFGVWWSAASGDWQWNSAYSSAEDARTRLTDGLARLVEAVEDERFEQLRAINDQHLGSNRDTLPAKTLYLYFPDTFLPIFQRQHLAYFLGLFGQVSAPELYGRNRQLFAHLRSLPEMHGMDSAQMMHFLYDSFPPPTAAFRIWKIAPGENASAWNECRDRGCITIGWLQSTDYRTLATKEEAQAALVAAGSPPGAYTPIRQFTDVISQGDIVVANKGRRGVVGIGRITSGYLPPDDPENVRPNDGLPHARRVEWLISETYRFDRNPSPNSHNQFIG